MQSVDIKYLSFKDKKGKFSLIPNSCIVFSLKHGVSRIFNFLGMKEKSNNIRNSIKQENLQKLNSVENAVLDKLKILGNSLQLDDKTKATVKEIITKRQEPSQGR